MDSIKAKLANQVPLQFDVCFGRRVYRRCDEDDDDELTGEDADVPYMTGDHIRWLEQGAWKSSSRHL